VENDELSQLISGKLTVKHHFFKIYGQLKQFAMEQPAFFIVKSTVNGETSLFVIGKATISMAIFNLQNMFV
jgi:hypothetical protein